MLGTGDKDHIFIFHGYSVIVFTETDSSHIFAFIENTKNDTQIKHSTEVLGLTPLHLLVVILPHMVQIFH